MATVFSPLATLSSSAAATISPKPMTPPPALPKSMQPFSSMTTTIFVATAAAAASVALSAAPPPSLAGSPPTNYSIYYGTAASAANYGGYGGNSSKKDAAEYVFDVPEGWKERLVSKVEKGTNGTDSEFYNPKKRSEKEYVTYLAGIRQLAPSDAVLNNLALSDVDLQDLIAGADDVRSVERKDDKGQLYYVYEVDGADSHSLISVTCANNKLYAHFVNAPAAEWSRDQETLRHVHESFKTVSF